MVRSQELLQIRHRITRADGTVIWVDENSRAYFDEHGKIVRIVGMVTDTTDRVQAEEALRQKDRELSEAQRVAQVGSWFGDAQSGGVTWSEELYRIAGLNPSLPAPTHTNEPRHFTAESWERMQPAIHEALRNGTPYELDLEMVRPDGTTRWVNAHGEPVRDITGRIVALRGTAQDITERKLADEALASVSRKLLEAQEQERSRLARELHDDINQRLALLAVILEGVRENLPVSAAESASQLDRANEEVRDLGREIQALSHRLHSSKMELLGLAVAAASFCREFSDMHKVKVEFHAEDVPKELPREVSLCLYRVLQEALQNAAKHSGSKEFEVSMTGGAGEIELKVHDSGIGFDPEEAMKGRGLGLTSMKERLRLVDGQLLIHSQPERGTTIVARVPVSSRARAAGTVG